MSPSKELRDEIKGYERTTIGSIDWAYVKNLNEYDWGSEYYFADTGNFILNVISAGDVFILDNEEEREPGNVYEMYKEQEYREAVRELLESFVIQ